MLHFIAILNFNVFNCIWSLKLLFSQLSDYLVFLKLILYFIIVQKVKFKGNINSVFRDLTTGIDLINLFLNSILLNSKSKFY